VLKFAAVNCHFRKKHTLIASIMYSCNCLQSSHRGVA